MKILFVSSGNAIDGISPIIKNQGDSLVNLGVSVSFYTIKGKGFYGYFKNIWLLRNYLNVNKFDIIHAHYLLSAIVVTLTFHKRIVVSLMGSDVKSKGYYKFIIRFFNSFFWEQLIVKSNDMKKTVGIESALVIPNGVNMEVFKPLPKVDSLIKIGWDPNKKHILFAADPSRKVKNFDLAKKSFDLLDNRNIDLHFLVNIPNSEAVYYYNAADLVLLTSFWEGSPNVIKEAMSCNKPIVSTNIGDVEWIFGPTNGCYMSEFNPFNIKSAIEEAIIFAEKFNSTEGQKRLLELGLNSESIALQILDTYKT